MTSFISGKSFREVISFFCIFLIVSVFGTSKLFGQEIIPKMSIIAAGAVTDFVVENNILYAATDQGIVDVFDLRNGNRIKQFTLPSITDFMGDEIAAKIYSIDKSDDQLLLVVQGKHGFRNVLIHQNDNFNKIIDADKDKMLIKKARFVDENKVLFGLLSNEIILFDIPTCQQIYKLQISAYSFSDYFFNEDKSEVITADESGIIHNISVSDGKFLKEYSGNNVDNVYQTVYHNGIIITGGQDRRVGIYNTANADNYFLEGDFLVYSVGLSHDGSIGAFSSSEDNDISLFYTDTKEIFQTLMKHKSTITKISFVSNSKIITSCEDPNINIWEINTK